MGVRKSVVFVLSVLATAVAAAVASIVPARAETCGECKGRCESERNTGYRKCSEQWPLLSDPARAECMRSVSDAFVQCRKEECYLVPGGPCAPKPDPVTAYGAFAFDPRSPLLPRAYEIVVDAPRAGTYYLDVVNLGGTLPMPDLSVAVNGLPAIDDRAPGAHGRTSYPLLLDAGRNRLVVSSSGTGDVALFVGTEPLTDP